ncbi:MAG: hypothetical protein RMK97_00615 [Sutterellaceae bacterium]|nr:hypothetical protein [Burkholderiaceae bacterium]MCX7901303.1 hypothetical protein [Burkholderiaceae bacterium]MDW8429003.1 hypothetical protein [Sutterellaceae bacterium]
MGWFSFLSRPSRAQQQRRERAMTRRAAAKPHIGATIYCADLRMTVQPGLSDELWRWLAERGWRELHDLSRRHQLRAVPASAVSALFDAPPERWEALLAEAVKQAIFKPTLEKPRLVA